MKESCRSTYSRAHTLAQASALFDINARSYEPHTRHSASSISSPSSISACRALTVISYCCLVLFEFNTTSKIRSQHKRKQKEKLRLDLYACEDFGWCERVQWNNLFYVYNYNKSGCQLDSFFFNEKKTEKKMKKNWMHTRHHWIIHPNLTAKSCEMVLAGFGSHSLRWKNNRYIH